MPDAYANAHPFLQHPLLLGFVHKQCLLLGPHIIYKHYQPNTDETEISALCKK